MDDWKDLTMKEKLEIICDSLVYGLVTGLIAGLVFGLVVGLTITSVTQVIALITHNPEFNPLALIISLTLLIIITIITLYKTNKR